MSLEKDIYITVTLPKKNKNDCSIYLVIAMLFVAQNDLISLMRGIFEIVLPQSFFGNYHKSLFGTTGRRIQSRLEEDGLHFFTFPER